MRILLVLEACGAGAGRHVIDLIDGLSRSGHDVSLIYSPVRAEAGFEDALGFMPRVTKRELPMRRAVGPGDWRSTRALKRLIKELGPFDIVHGHSSKAGALLRLAASGSDAPRLYTPHAPITMDPTLSAAARFVYGTAERLLGHFCERIICVSAAERDHLASIGLSEDKLCVVHNGIKPLPDTDRDAVRRQLQLDPETVCFGFVGRISHQKGVDRMISAFAMARGRMGNAHLAIVGDGPLLDEMQSLARNLGVARDVTFTGHANGIEMMAGFDVFLLPSRYEGLPYALLEAAASGLPIITTDVGGAGVVVQDGENGYVLPEQSAELLADRLTELARNGQLRHEMSACSAQIAEKFTVDRMVADTIAVYEEALAAPA
ncbi:MAG: glycosyltransferase family 4 protein [Gammaproteobacteria bacterium]